MRRKIVVLAAIVAMLTMALPAIAGAAKPEQPGCQGLLVAYNASGSHPNYHAIPLETEHCGH